MKKLKVDKTKKSDKSKSRLKTKKKYNKFKQTKSVIKKISKDIVAIKSIFINTKEKTIEFNGQVNMDKGLIEYLLVSSMGKLHESLLKTDVEPFDVQTALLLLGLKGTKNRLKRQGDSRKPTGDLVNIWAEWESNGKTEKQRVESWVLNRSKGLSLKPIDWVYTGSYIFNGVFVAQKERSIVAIYRDPAAIIDNPLPGADKDEIWYVNKEAVPKVGTKVKLIIKKAKRTK